MAEYFRGNLFANTPDILHEALQRGGPAAFRMRLALAATLSSLYGIYSGFELCESDPVPGTEEYLDSEKYEVKARDWDRARQPRGLHRPAQPHPARAPASSAPPAPASTRPTRPHVLSYRKATPEGDDAPCSAVNLDPCATPRDATLADPAGGARIRRGRDLRGRRAALGSRAIGRGATLDVRARSRRNPAAIWRVERWRRREQYFEYFAS